ncbi:hypothetical protein [Streptobacillus moniliformis]|uniref:hypothetical protein n=1 Tax=Streptobacillus moniliformis TaxID=34105 RepID=UPI0007E310F7|nr:hypothetical protein [Streptobacillus moniliformis]
MKLQKLKIIMFQKNKTQSELMKLFNLKYPVINKKFNGHTEFSLNEIKIIKNWLELSNDETIDIFID